MADNLPDDLEDETPEQVRARVAAEGGIPDDLEGETAPPAADAAPIARPADAPDETSIASTPYLPAKPPSLYDKARLVARAFGADNFNLIPDEKMARGAVAAVAQGPALNWADEAAGLLAKRDQAIKNFVAGRTEVDPDWAYRNARDKFRQTEGEFREEHPALGIGLTAASGAMLGGPIQGTGRGALRYAPAAVEGAIGGMGAAETPEEMGIGAAVGAPLGVAGQTAGELAGDAAGAFRRFLTGMYQPSQAARYLQSKGVNELTLGQMVPESMAAQFEEVGTSVGGVGPSITSQREAGRRAWQNAVMREATAPGAAPPNPGADIASQLDEAYRGFRPAYAEARGYSIDPQRIQSAMSALDDATIHASDQERAQAAKFVSDQMTALRIGEDGGVSSDGVIGLRSFLRDKIRSLKGDLNQPFRELYQNVVDHLSTTLDDSLPPEAAEALRAADKAYAGHKTVERAVFSAGDQRTGFSPSQLSEAVKAAATERGPYARGAGGELRSLAEAGKETLDARIPTTGARLMASGPAQWVTGPASYLANLPGPKSFLTGQLPAQASAESLIQRAGLDRYGNVAQQSGVSSMLPASRAIMERSPEAQGAAQQSTSDFVGTAMRTNPELLGSYSPMVENAMAQGNLPILHYRLMQTDPAYREQLEQARKAMR